MTDITKIIIVTICFVTMIKVAEAGVGLQRTNDHVTVFLDEETGCQYLIATGYTGKAGGMTERLNSNGVPICARQTRMQR